MSLILAVDPGTYTAGAALWDTQRPEQDALLDVWPIELPESVSAWTRIQRFQDYLKGHAFLHGSPGLIVCEWLTGRNVPRDVELDAAVLMVRGLAEDMGARFTVTRPQEWRQSCAVAGVVPRSKEDVRFALEARFPTLSVFRDQPAGLDAVEAVGIGLYAWSLERLTPSAQSKRHGRRITRS